MRRSFVATCAIAITTFVLIAAGTIPRGYAQLVSPMGSEFDSNSQAPFSIVCAQSATPPCPDQPGNSTYNVNSQSPGQLRIYTLFGSLLGTSTQASNNARNMFLQPVSSGADYTLTTKLTFPANVTSLTPSGQTAGILVRQDDDNFIYVARVFTNGQARLEFLQETNGTDIANAVAEGSLNATLYLRVVKSGSAYQGYYSFDNVAFTPIPTSSFTATGTIVTTPVGTMTSTPTSTPTPNGYVAAYGSPSVGLFAYGGNQNTAVNTNPVAADFDWFRVGSNSLTPGPTASATLTGTTAPLSTPAATIPSTSTGTPAATIPPTSTSIPTPTPTFTVIPTWTPAPTTTATATNTSIATPTPQPAPARPTRVKFKYTSLWYHTVREGTYDHLEVQANLKARLGIWVHVYFPSGKHLDYFENTTNHGYWSKSFNVPFGAMSKYSTQALITLRLWHGRDNQKNYANFTVIRK